MSDKLSIKVYPDQALTKRAKLVKKFDEDLRKLIIQMSETLDTYKGLGLSASQVGIPLQLLVYKADGKEGCMINPTIVGSRGGGVIDDEGCLSFPGIYVKIERPETIVVKFQDDEGVEKEEFFEGLIARVIQHEVDHLSGLTIVDYLSKLKRDIVKKKMIKQKKEFAALEKRLGKNIDHAQRAQQTLQLPRG